MELKLSLNQDEIQIKNVKRVGEKLSFLFEGEEFHFDSAHFLKTPLVKERETTFLFSHGEIFEVAPLTRGGKKRGDDHHMISPMPGKIIKIMTSVGASVKKGEPLLILEAMKMEHLIKASMDGVVEKIVHNVGEIVASGIELIILKE